jgi:hypothetical protein
MIGVILWSSPVKEKAVIWCEDHGALAYLQGKENLAFPDDWPESGDLVELEVETVKELRHARSVSLVSGNRRSDLPGLLRGIGVKPETARPVLRLISGPDSEVQERPLKIAAAS